MSQASDEQSTESGYIFVAFLLLMSMVAATVSMFALMALNNQRSANAYLDSETSYQMAQTGLNVWMGKIREDYEWNHWNSDLDDMSKYSWCEDMSGYSAAVGFGPSRRTRSCVGSGSGSSDPRETLLHHWGWGHPITDAADEDGDTVLLGERVFLPSGKLKAQQGDSGYFRILRVEAASGELQQTPGGLETSCKSTSGQGELNVNTASHKFLQEVAYDTNPIRTLTEDMADAIIEERSGSSKSLADPDGNGVVELDEEVYDLSNADPFDSKGDVCDFLDKFSKFNKKDHCKPADAIFPGNIHVISHDGKFCADIRGASIEVPEQSDGISFKNNNKYTVKSRYDIRVKVQRPTQKEDTKPLQVLTVQKL
ncbi:MAG: hypothetical protein ABEH89_01345 [bacterium]